ncbi:hypothetical protein [Actinoplanes sp. M2I2]|uniref:hypothetical protein n=1 Tax=Actinoplanes sp. M2I2 TaxID=1734444 RepID=UPI00202192A7|nr:hypothetical protein [Actinoplanes sp. M2I2]
MSTEWHATQDEILRYVRQELPFPQVWSVDAHLGSCARCRAVLAGATDAAPARRGWERLEDELHAPQPGRVERALGRAGMSEHTARLLMATRTLSRPWLLSAAVMLLLTVLVAQASESSSMPLLFLAVAPLLPLLGVAFSFGPGVDPTYELTLVAPISTFRLLLLRTAAVTATTTALSLVATVAVPGAGLVAIGWLLPSLALITLSLVLMSRLDSVVAAAVPALLWVGVLVFSAALPGDAPVPFTTIGQIVTAAAAVAAGLSLSLIRGRFESHRPSSFTPHVTTRRLS